MIKIVDICRIATKKRQDYSILLRKVYHKHQYFSMIFNNFSDFYNKVMYKVIAFKKRLN